MNKKHSYETHECSVCLKENETPEHIYICNEICKISGKKKDKLGLSCAKLRAEKADCYLPLAIG